MKIVLLNDDYPPYARNSVSQITATLATEYKRRGHIVYIITTHRKGDNPHIDSESYIISIPISYRPSLRHWLCLFHPSISRKLNKILKEIQPDVIHAHNIHQYLTYDSLRIAKKYTKNVYITLHDVMSFSFSRLATQAYLKSEGKNITLTTKEQIQQVGIIWNPIRNFLIRQYLKKARKIIAVSNALEKALHANNIYNTMTIHHGIDVFHWNVDKEQLKKWKKTHNLQEGGIILFGGRISIDKGAVAFLHALQKIHTIYPHVQGLIVGNKKEWDAVLQHANIPLKTANKCITTGWILPEELPLAFASCDIATTPSLCLDTFNLMNIEAMALGKPVVGTIFGGTPEIVQHGITGYICSPQNTEEYAKYLLDLLKHPEKAIKMGKEGKKRVQTHFSLKKNIDQYLSLFSETHSTETLQTPKAHSA